MRFYHYWNVKSRSPCFSEVAEFPCPVAFLTACWEGVFGYSRRPSRGFGRMQFCWSSSFVCLQIEPNNPCGDEWNPLSLQPGTDALFPLTTNVHWHCWMCNNGDASPTRAWYINYCQTDTSYPMFSYKQRNKKCMISQVHLNRYKRSKVCDFCTTNVIKPPLVFHWLNKQIMLASRTLSDH